MLRKIKRYGNYMLHPVIGEVWEFHRITDAPSTDVRYQPYDITPDRLESVIVEYQNKGYRFLSIDDVCDILQNLQQKSQIQKFFAALCMKKFICVTLDDGYEDNYTNAYPIFQQYHIPFSIYITSSFIDNKFLAREDTPPSLKTWQIKEIAANPLCTIGAHTKTHPNMATLSEEQQREELFGSIEQLEAIISAKINHITIPYGAYNQATWRLVSKSGIRSNVRGWGGPVRINCTANNLPRIIIEQNKKTY